jgi:hypothetical protein
VVGLIVIQPAFDGTRRDVQRAPACRRLDCLEVQPVDAPGAYERLDLGDDLRVEDRLEPPFLAASSPETASGVSNWASAHRSHTRQYASTRFRNSWPDSTC